MTTEKQLLPQHPPGLATLFMTELWERFSYYGMRALLILYMTAPTTAGGLGFSIARAASLYGTYTMSVYLLALPGGFIADRFLGARKAVLLGGCIITLGHLCLVFTNTLFFYTGLICIAIGTGLLKPSISTLVGSLYAPFDVRRDAGFAIFFMGINIGAALAPILCGYLAQSEDFKDLLAQAGLNPYSSWHWGFGVAAVGMMLGLALFLYRYQQFVHADMPYFTGNILHSTIDSNPEEIVISRTSFLQTDEQRRITAIIILFIFTVIFGVVSEQAGSSLNLFADRLTDRTLFGWEFPSSWFQSVIPLYVIILSPLVSTLWLYLGERQPSSPTKFSLSLLCVGLAYTCMIPASLQTAEGLVGPWWLLLVFFFQEIGAVLLNPTGLSVVTKLAPVRLAGVMMGVWFLASAVASKISGFLAGHFDAANPVFLAQYFGVIALVMLIAAGILALLTPFIRRLMGSVR